MSASLSVLQWLALVLALLLLAALTIPVRLWAQVQATPDLTYRVSASVLSGLASRIPLVDSASPRKPAKRQSLGSTPNVQRASGRKSKFRFASGARVVSALPGLLADLLHIVHFDVLEVDAEFGLSDPTDTGQLYGCLIPLQYGLPWLGHAHVALRPNFEQACFVGELRASLRFTVAALLPPVVRFGWRAFGPKS